MQVLLSWPHLDLPIEQFRGCYTCGCHPVEQTCVAVGSSYVWAGIDVDHISTISMPSYSAQLQMTDKQCFDADRDFFMSAKEAVDYGLIDGVISKPALLASQQSNGASH